MKMKVRRILISFHFIALAIAVLNTLLKSLTKYGLDSQVELTIEAAAVISGFILFFFYLIPFKKINFYFSIYALLAILSILTWVFRSFFFGFILVIALYPVFPDEKKYEHDGITISVPFQGFMSRCCHYQVKERKLFIFEKTHGIIASEGAINFETLKISHTKSEIVLSYSTGYNDEIRKQIKK